MRARRRQGDPTVADPRILGSGAFVERLLAQTEARTRATLRMGRPRPALEVLAQRVGAHTGLTVAELCSARRTKAVRQARRLLCQVAVRHLGFSGATVARYLGVTTSAVNRAAWTEPVPDLAALL